MNTKIQRPNLHLTGLLIILVLLLSSGQDLFHNHAPGLEHHHHDCPAQQLYLLFNSVLIFNFVLFVLIIVFLILKSFDFDSKYGFFSKNYYSRAPPFQF